MISYRVLDVTDGKILNELYAHQLRDAMKLADDYKLRSELEGEPHTFAVTVTATIYETIGQDPNQEPPS